jgi:hypothetical protein
MRCVPGLLLGMPVVMPIKPQSQEAGQANANISEQERTSDLVTSVEGPARIKAGETAKFTVTLSPAPRFEGGRLTASFGLVGGPDIYRTGPL